MCKVFAVPGINDDNREKVEKLVKEAAKIMSRTDGDGLGYAAITKDCKVYGERWVKNDDAFDVRENPKPTKAKEFLHENFGEALTDFSLVDEPVYEQFGDMSQENITNTTAVILHARKKTEGKICVKNTHPFYVVGDKHEPDTALIHNGGIVNHLDFKKHTSTCDSEVILNNWMDLNMSFNPDNIETLSKDLRGIYTVAVLSSTWDAEEGAMYPVLDLFKSNKPLVCGYIAELETPVFATSDFILKEACKIVGLTPTSIFDVKDGHYIRIDAETGSRVGDIIPFTPSERYKSYYNGTGYGGSKSTTRTPLPGKTPANTTKHTGKEMTTTESRIGGVNDAKKAFEKKHPDLFQDDYYEVGELSQEEKEALEVIEASDNHSVRALKLVQMAVGLEG